MIIKATFIGKNVLGYVNGTEYQLKLANKRGMTICRMNGSGLCPYESLSAFLKNWDKIEKVNEI